MKGQSETGNYYWCTWVEVKWWSLGLKWQQSRAVVLVQLRKYVHDTMIVFECARCEAVDKNAPVDNHLLTLSVFCRQVIPKLLQEHSGPVPPPPQAITTPFCVFFVASRRDTDWKTAVQIRWQLSLVRSNIASGIYRSHFHYTTQSSHLYNFKV